MNNTWAKIKQFKHKIIPKDTFKTNVLTLMTGTTIAQVASIIVSPILTRLYTSTDFGVFALYSSLVGIIGVIVGGRYDLTIILPKKRNDAINLTVLSIILSFFTSGLICLFIFLFHSQIGRLLKNGKLLKLLYLAPVSILLTGIYQTLNFWFTRQKKYPDLAKNRVAQSISNIITTLGFGFLKINSGLVIGGILGQCIATVQLGWLTLKEWKNKTITLSYQKMKLLALHYREYPLKSSLGAITNACSYQIEYFLMSIFFTLSGVGNYYFANRIASIPNVFMSGAIWQVFLGENRSKTKEELFKAVNFYQQCLFKIITLPMFSILFILVDLWEIIFGKNFIAAVNYLYPLIIASHVNLVVSSFSLFIIINRPDAEMIFNIFLVILKVLVIFMSYVIFHNFYSTVIAMSLIQFLMFFILGSWNYVQLQKPAYHFLLLYLKNIIAIIPYLIILYVTKLFVNDIVILSILFLILNILNWVKEYNEYAKQY